MSIFESLHVLTQLWFWVLLGSALFLALYSWQFGLDSDTTTTTSSPTNISASAKTPIGRRALRQQQQQEVTTFRMGDYIFGVLPSAVKIKWREIDVK